MFFLVTFLDLIFPHFMLILWQNWRFWDPLRNPLGPKMATKIAIISATIGKNYLWGGSSSRSWSRPAPQRPPRALQTSIFLDFGLMLEFIPFQLHHHNEFVKFRKILLVKVFAICQTVIKKMLRYANPVVLSHELQKDNNDICFSKHILRPFRCSWLLERDYEPWYLAL